jgi:hypothetical protein
MFNPLNSYLDLSIRKSNANLPAPRIMVVVSSTPQRIWSDNADGVMSGRLMAAVILTSNKPSADARVKNPNAI